jgi:hypothetical protein
VAKDFVIRNDMILDGQLGAKMYPRACMCLGAEVSEITVARCGSGRYEKVFEIPGRLIRCHKSLQPIDTILGRYCDGQACYIARLVFRSSSNQLRLHQVGLQCL